MLVMLDSASKRVNECEYIRLRHSIGHWQITAILDATIITNKLCKYAKLRIKMLNTTFLYHVRYY